MSTPWWLYLLECADGSCYCGIARDVGARYAEHVSGKGAKYTRARPPVTILGQLAFPDRSSASKAEYFLKQHAASRKRALIRSAAAFSAFGVLSAAEHANP